MSNSLGGDAYARNVADSRMDGRMTDLLYEINILFFFKEKSVVIDLCSMRKQ